jgi:carbonic anhydrase/acetyltransferase-like protein (isoleucine patch superfamily)
VIGGFRGGTPSIDPSAYVVASAVIVGDVTIGAQSSVWFHAVVRGDVMPVRIGARTNVQDNATLHVTSGRAATTLGDDVTVGHAAICHGCTVGNRVLVGMGAILLDGVDVGDDCLIGAGALLTPRTRIPAGQLVLGNPARAVRALTADERHSLVRSAESYLAHVAAYRAEGIR